MPLAFALSIALLEPLVLTVVTAVRTALAVEIGFMAVGKIIVVD